MSEEQQDEKQGVVEAEDVGGLKSALQKERSARRELEKQLKAFADINPDEYRRMAQELESLKSLHEAQLQRAEQLSRSLAETEMMYGLIEAFYQAGGKRDPALAKLLSKQLLSQVRQEGGNLVVVDQSGSVRKREDGKPMDLLDLMREAREGSYGVLFDPIDTGGSGATGTQVPVLSRRKLLRTTDPYKLGQNLEAIASGEIVVDLG